MEKIAVQLLPVEIAVVVCNPYTFGDRLEFMLSKVKGRLPHPISHIKWIGLRRNITERETTFKNIGSIN